MSEKSKKRFYWNEGVTRREVETALSANKYPALYRRSARRVFVVAYIVLTILLIFSSAILAEKLASYIYTISGALLIVIYLVLRFSVRLIADAPTELLDERLIVIRDRTYWVAYRWLSFVFGIVFGLAIASDFSFSVDRWGPVLFALAGLVAGIPSMILAWRLPSESQLTEEN